MALRDFEARFSFVLALLLAGCYGHFGGDGEEIPVYIPPAPLVHTLSDDISPVLYFEEDPSPEHTIVSFRCRIDSGSWNECTSPETITGIAPGEYTVEVVAVDSEGRESDPTSKIFRRGQMPKGFNGEVNAIASLSDGSFVVGGNFNRLKAETTPGLAKLTTDGDFAPSCLIGGGFNDEVLAIVKVEDEYVIGGKFTDYNGTSVGRIIKINRYCEINTDFNFNAGGGFNGAVYSVVHEGGFLYIGGSFTSYNGLANKIVKLQTDGIKIGAFNNVTVSEPVYAMAISGNDLYVGWVPAFPSGKITRLDATTGDPGGGSFNGNIGVGFDNTVYSLLFLDSFLYAGGNFTEFKGVDCPDAIVKILADGSAGEGLLDADWNTALGAGLGPGGAAGDIRAISSSEGYLYLAGAGSGLDGAPVPSGIYKFDTGGIFYNVFNSGTGKGLQYGGAFALARSIVVSGDDIYTGGNFNKFGGEEIACGILKIGTDGTVDTSFQSEGEHGFNKSGTVMAIVSSGTELFIGGSFEYYGGISLASGIAKFSAGGELDTGFNTASGTGFLGGTLTVYALAVDSNNNIYAGGNFTSFNGSLSIPQHILKLSSNGIVDSAFQTNATTGGDGFSNPVYALTLSDSSLYAGGAFINYRGVPRNRIVKMDLNGIEDSAFLSNTELTGTVYAIALSGTSLFVGGEDVDTRIWKFDAINGGEEDAGFDLNIGPGFDNEVYALFISGSALYVGGEFTDFNGGIANRIKKLNFDGTEVAPFDASIGTNGNVYALYLSGDGLYVGGAFTGGIAKFDAINGGAADAAFAGNVGTGFNGDVNVVSLFSNYLYTGGYFSVFDTEERNDICRLEIDGTLNEYFQGQGN